MQSNPIGRPKRDTSSLTPAQIRLVERKEKYDADRYARISKRAKYGSPEHLSALSKKAIAKRKAPGHSTVTKILGVYTWNATVNGVPFELTREQFTRLIFAPCHYCGAPPSSVKYGRGVWTPVTYNGIDRVENSLGYTPENSVTCCKMCNLGKRDKSVQEFLEWITRVYLHQENRQQTQSE